MNTGMGIGHSHHHIVTVTGKGIGEIQGGIHMERTTLWARLNRMDLHQAAVFDDGEQLHTNLEVRGPHPVINEDT